MIQCFKLEEKTAVPIPYSEYFQWVIEDPDQGSRIVRSDVLRNGEDLIHVSTVFLLGIVHRWLNGSDPLLFETMVFGGVLDLAQWRYSTWEQAEAGHQAVLDQLFREMPHLTRVVPEDRVTLKIEES